MKYPRPSSIAKATTSTAILRPGFSRNKRRTRFGLFGASSDIRRGPGSVTTAAGSLSVVVEWAALELLSRPGITYLLGIGCNWFVPLQARVQETAWPRCGCKAQ